MSSPIPTPTTTYPFTYTVYSTSHASSKFTKPTLIPSLFPFSPASSCSANSRSNPTPLPSSYPQLPPSGRGAACMISNDGAVNDHAFWDLYACCKGFNLNAMGSPNLCSAQCIVGEGQTWQEVGECLSKRVDVVVCKPRQEEIGKSAASSASASASASGGASASRTSSVSVSASGSAGAASSSASGGASGSGSASPSTGAANTVGVVHMGGSKAGVLLFGILAVGSFAGMML